ncbi:MAG: M81 family metallopeptidase [Gammaproteobacteria bacterium]|jgi:microcystin degradation protein MlrC|nr:M81 family metallopeptidase [Gammaproteobacteria bacterium]
MKCVVAMFQHETNTFSPLPTPLSAFATPVGLELPPAGEQAMALYGQSGFAFAALLQQARAHGAEVVVPIAAYAEPSGKVDDAAFDSICNAICTAVQRGCDAVLLDLHGAMVTASFDDGEGELLRRIREIDEQVPIAVALDFHANVSRTMVENCQVIDGYRTYPHTDMFATGERVAATLFNTVLQKIPTRMSWYAIPLATHMLAQSPNFEPMQSLMNQGVAAVDNAEVLNASVFGGFPLADIPELSLSVVVIEKHSDDPDRQKGAGLCHGIANQAWQQRDDFYFAAEPLAESIVRAKQCQEFPVVVADHGDNSGAGGSTDDMTVLAEMLALSLDGIVAGPIYDPQAVASLVALGVGIATTINLGGKTDAPSIGQKGRSLSCIGVVENITDGRFVIQGPMQTGLEVNLGTSVVFDIGSAKILLTCERWEPYDPGCFTQAGLDYLNAKYLLIKSRQHFRATFEDFAKHIILAAGPGVCSSDYNQFNFINLGAGKYPINKNIDLRYAEMLSVISDAI